MLGAHVLIRLVPIISCSKSTSPSVMCLGSIGLPVSLTTTSLMVITFSSYSDVSQFNHGVVIFRSVVNRTTHVYCTRSKIDFCRVEYTKIFRVEAWSIHTSHKKKSLRIHQKTNTQKSIFVLILPSHTRYPDSGAHRSKVAKMDIEYWPLIEYYFSTCILP